jgi:hypothetical protein
MSAIAGWENFYGIVGSSAGARIGVLFVVMTLIATRPMGPGRSQGADAFAPHESRNAPHITMSDHFSMSRERVPACLRFFPQPNNFPASRTRRRRSAMRALWPTLTLYCDEGTIAH